MGLFSRQMAPWPSICLWFALGSDLLQFEQVPACQTTILLVSTSCLTPSICCYWKQELRPMQSLPPRHLCTCRSSIDTDMALLADIFICQPSISHHAIAILVDCWSTCWSICRSTPDQVSANMSTNMSAYTWPVCPLTPGWHISRLCFKIRTRELGFSVMHKISQSEVWK